MCELALKTAASRLLLTETFDTGIGEAGASFEGQQPPSFASLTTVRLISA